MPLLTEAEARIRAGLLDVWSYEVFFDLTADPVRSRSEIRFGCTEPGASTFADFTGGAVLSAVLNGRAAGQPADGRLSLPELADANVLTVEAVAGSSRYGEALARFTDPADGSDYVTIKCYPTRAPGLFCCFDQPDLSASVTVSVAAPAGWDCVANGAVTQRPPAGQAGVWRFAAVRMRPFEVTLCAGPFAADLRREGAVSMTVRRRRSLAGAAGVARLPWFGDVAWQAIERYERRLGVPCPYPNYDVVFVPGLGPLALSVQGLMLVNESLLTRMIDPDDDFAAMVCRHEALHLWFGCLVGFRWWDDVWLDEAMATYLSYAGAADGAAGEWTAFCYRDKERAYRADELPGSEPVSSPVADAAGGLSKPYAITYVKGASVIRQLAALIGADALQAGLTDYLTRYRASGVAALDDLVGCWSRASGQDLAGWAHQWLRLLRDARRV